MDHEISVGKLNINYKKKGSGPPLLILHGWGGSSDSWVEVQKNLSSKFEVLVPDLPGFGESDYPQQPWTFQDYSIFLEKFVRQLRLKRICLTGHSFGGSLAVKFAGQHPQLVEKLVLVDSAGIKPEPGLKTKLLIGLSKIGKKLFRRAPSWLESKARKPLYLLMRNRDYTRANPVMKETMKNVFDYYYKVRSDRGEFLSDLGEVKAETLVIWGERDETIPVEYGEKFEEKINKANFEIVRGAGHSPHLDEPEQTAQLISNFFD